MPIIGSGGQGTLTVSYPSNIKITNLSLTTAGTEYSHALEDNCNEIIMRCRNGFAQLQISFVSGETGTKYFTITKGGSLSLDGLNLVGKILYIQSSLNSVVVELLEKY